MFDSSRNEICIYFRTVGVLVTILIDVQIIVYHKAMLSALAVFICSYAQ
jgi:hypothetical protein